MNLHVIHLQADKKHFLIKLLYYLFFSLLLSISLNSCIFLGPSEASIDDLIEEIPVTTVFFWVEIPENTPAHQGIDLIILDEVAGLDTNPTIFEMIQVDETHYGISLDVPLGGVIKYRYSRHNETIDEYQANGSPVRYRMILANNGSETHDIVSRWEDTNFESSSGRITGRVRNLNTGNPISGALVFAGGQVHQSQLDGSFTIYNLPEGQHNVLVYMPDGSFLPTQQNALVLAEAETPTDFFMTQAPMVNVTFRVHVPENTPAGSRLRLLGNLSTLGNSFSEQFDGFGTIATSAPLMTLVEDNTYQIQLSLPAETTIRYIYSLGDGYQNTEYSLTNQVNTRHLMIPNTNDSVLIEDSIDSWNLSFSDSIWFLLTAPVNTPELEHIYIQFYLDTWLPPLPMLPVGGNQWAFQLYSPIPESNILQFRYCRNMICGSNTSIFQVNLANLQTSPRQITQTISEWENYSFETPQVSVSTRNPAERTEALIQGVSLFPDYQLGSSVHFDYLFQELNLLNANMLVITPTWSITNTDPLLLEPVYGSDIDFQTLGNFLRTSHENQIEVAIFPHISNPGELIRNWDDFPQNEIWWGNWLRSYSNFILQHAHFAETQGVNRLILGGEWLGPTLPNQYTLYSSQGFIPDVYWTGLFAQIREIYSGEILFQIPSSTLAVLPDFLSEADELIILWDTPFLTPPGNPNLSYEEQALAFVIQQLFLIAEQIDIPIIISIAAPSITGSGSSCIQIPEGSGQCINWLELAPNQFDYTLNDYDPIQQAQIYNAILAASYQTDWISGVISEGFFFPAITEDFSSSIHGKPAEFVLGYWFNPID